MSDNVKGYEIKRAIAFENDRGFALGENPQAVQPFATWQFTEDASGRRDYELRVAPGNPDREPGESKSIAARLAEGAKQAARDNAAHTAPAKGTEKDR